MTAKRWLVRKETLGSIKLSYQKFSGLSSSFKFLNSFFQPVTITNLSVQFPVYAINFNVNPIDLFFQTIEFRRKTINGFFQTIEFRRKTINGFFQTIEFRRKTINGFFQTIHFILN